MALLEAHGERTLTLPDVSVVIPCRNEAENVETITTAVAHELGELGVDYEIIIIDNASTDDTVPISKGLCASDHRIRLIVNNRDYGQMRSPTHGIYQASGRAVIGMCADFQDPPALLREFVVRWRAGAQIVLGVRRTEKGSIVRRTLRNAGYAFFRTFGDYPVIPGATGFGLYDRRVIDCLAHWHEPEPFFRGMLVESGFRLETVSYDRPPRAAGTSNNNLQSLVGFAISSVTACSKRLLRLPLYFAAILLIGSFATGILALETIIVRRDVIPDACLALGEFAFAWVFFFLGLLGDQVRVVSERTRQTPLVIEKERVNFPETAR